MSNGEVTQLDLIVNNQESLSQQLMDSVRDELLSKKYDKLYISTAIGILEMLKTEMYERTKR